TFYPNFNNELYHKMLAIFKLDQKAKINTFSKGMRRQVSLILAFSTGFKYLLLDEAFDGLDPVMRLALKRMISDEIINKQICVIISSHNIRELEDIADEIVLIQNGNINLSGDVDTIRKTYHKYQMAFALNIDESYFADIDYTEIDINSKFITIITKNDNKDALSALNPLIIEELPMSLEEIFVYHMKEQGYGQDI
ncbi:MAG: ABC transporter ATP-binding protein, partial [Erysipelotrichaceae bacterium]|nr:ABC transporter ATP-binding protein [Erysipelotrichaceae bacterium]